MLFLNSIRAHVKGLESWRPAEVPCPLLGLNAKRGRRAWDTCGHAPSSGGLGTEGGPATRHNTGGPEGVTLTETSLSQQDAQDGSTYTGPGGQVHRQPAGGWVPGPGAGGALLCRVMSLVGGRGNGCTTVGTCWMPLNHALQMATVAEFVCFTTIEKVCSLTSSG